MKAKILTECSPVSQLVFFFFVTMP